MQLSSKKKLCCLVIFCTALISIMQMTAFAATPTIKADTVTAQISTGATVDVDIFISGNPGIVGGTFDIEYDSTKLALKGIKNEQDFFPAAYVYYGQTNAFPDTDGSYTVAWNGYLQPSNLTTDSGRLITLEFAVLSGATAGNTAITLSNLDFIDYNINLVDFNMESGNITLTGTGSSGGSTGSTGGSGSQGSTSGTGTATTTTPTTPATPTTPTTPATPTTTITPTMPQGSFSDVKSTDWFSEAVNFVYGNGLMSGTGNGKFSPNMSTSRGMIITVIHRLIHTPEPITTAAFKDVTTGAYYASAAAWGAENEIVKGYGNGLFGPNDNITREQLAVILYKYAQFRNASVSAAGTGSAAFSDASDVSSWAKTAVDWAVNTGLMSGKGNNKLDPKGEATRAEVAAMIKNYCEKFGM